MLSYSLYAPQSCSPHAYEQTQETFCRPDSPSRVLLTFRPITQISTQKTIFPRKVCLSPINPVSSVFVARGSLWPSPKSDDEEPCPSMRDLHPTTEVETIAMCNKDEFPGLDSPWTNSLKGAIIRTPSPGFPLEVFSSDYD